MKPHYFQQDAPDADDMSLQMAIMQGYVPPTCLLGGMTVLNEIRKGLDPCWGCAGPRERCHGKPIRKDAA